MEKNKKKRLIISSVYLVLFLSLVWFIYSVMRPIETCSDGIKNQNEEDVDCGGVCSKCKKLNAVPLVVQDKGFLDSGSSSQDDFWALVQNPNQTLGSKSFTYKIDFKDESGQIIASKTGTNFILPGEKKYIIENNIPVGSKPSSVEVTISNSNWVEFNQYYEKPQIKIVNKTYNEITSGVGFSESLGLVKNESPYDFNLIKIGIVLRDSNNNVIAVNSTQMRTVRSQEERDYRVFWPNRFSGSVNNIEAQFDVDVFSSEAFAKKNFTPQSFQQY